MWRLLYYGIGLIRYDYNPTVICLLTLRSQYFTVVRKPKWRFLGNDEVEIMPLVYIDKNGRATSLHRWKDYFGIIWYIWSFRYLFSINESPERESVNISLIYHPDTNCYLFIVGMVTEILFPTLFTPMLYWVTNNHIYSLIIKTTFI